MAPGGSGRGVEREESRGPKMARRGLRWRARGPERVGRAQMGRMTAVKSRTRQRMWGITTKTTTVRIASLTIVRTVITSLVMIIISNGCSKSATKMSKSTNHNQKHSFFTTTNIAKRTIIHEY